MLVGRSRCLSWDQEPGLHLGHQEGSADSPPTCPLAAAPLPPLPETAPGREEEVAQLHAYLADMRGCRELPEAFPILVQRALEKQRGTSVTGRGWLGMAGSTSSGPAGATLSAAPLHAEACELAAAAAAREPRLSAALLKVQQLDSALAAADQRAAAAAAAARELEEQCQVAGDNIEAPIPGSGAVREGDTAHDGGGLTIAMAHERRRLQAAEQLRRALHRDAASPTASAEAPVGGGCPAGLTTEQNTLLQALLTEPEEPAAAAVNPYAAGLAELGAVDAQLGALRFASGAGGSASTVAAEAVGDAPQGLEQEDAAVPDLEAIREGYLRAQHEARAAAQQLRSIDAALRALKTGAVAAC